MSHPAMEKLTLINIFDATNGRFQCLLRTLLTMYALDATITFGGSPTGVIEPPAIKNVFFMTQQ